MTAAQKTAFISRERCETSDLDHKEQQDTDFNIRLVSSEYRQWRKAEYHGPRRINVQLLNGCCIVTLAFSFLKQHRTVWMLSHFFFTILPVCQLSWTGATGYRATASRPLVLAFWMYSHILLVTATCEFTSTIHLTHYSVYGMKCWIHEGLKYSNLVSAVLRGLRQTAQKASEDRLSVPKPALKRCHSGVWQRMCGSSGLWWKLKRIFRPCLVDHGYILTLVFKVVLAQPAIISITCWFLRRVPCAAELITPSVLNNCCYPPALTFCPALPFCSFSLPSSQRKKAHITHTLASVVKPLNQLIFIPLMFPLTPSIPIRFLPTQTFIKPCWWVILWGTHNTTQFTL